MVYLPLNTAYQKSELSYFFGDAEPAIIVGRPDAAPLHAALRPQATVFTLGAGEGTLQDSARDQSEDFNPARSAPDDLAAILYTSVTSGRA